MWSCRLAKKSNHFQQSIANSKTLAEKQAAQSLCTAQEQANYSYFFTKIGQFQHVVELFIASLILAMLLTLAEAGAWHGFRWGRFIEYGGYINWVLLCFVAVVQWLQKTFSALTLPKMMLLGFIILQVIVLLTTMSLNILSYWGHHLHWRQLNLAMVFENVGLHLSYGVLLGSFCFRYLYLREQWLRQQNSELKARIQALQARIHPHFLFNSLNNVVSLISIDPDKAEQMLLDLSRLFRASLQELKLVSLQDEIELCQRYLAIEQVRLGARLQVEWKLLHRENFLHSKIPLLTLQPLLENSIFHGVEKNLTPSTISILIEVIDRQVNIVITNPYREQSTQQQGHGLALQNIYQRLQAYYGQSVSLQHYASDGTFTLVLQYQYK